MIILAGVVGYAIITCLVGGFLWERAEQKGKLEETFWAFPCKAWIGLLGIVWPATLAIFATFLLYKIFVFCYHIGKKLAGKR